MKNVLTALLFVVAANVFASTPYFVKVTEKSVVLNFSQWKTAPISVNIKDDNGNIVFGEKIEKPQASRQYNLSKMNDGEYTISIENKQKIATQNVTIKRGQLLVSPNIKETFKPVFIIKENVWAIQALSLEKDAKVSIINEDGNVLYSETINQPSVQKKYNVAKLPTGNYEIVYSVDEQVFVHNAFKK